jgi:hypothetical protein
MADLRPGDTEITMDTRTRDDATLPAALAERARGASDLRLAADVTGGIIAILLALMWGGKLGFFLLAAGGCFLGFGVWGIADRELSERGPDASSRQTRLLQLAKYVATIVGAISAALLAVGIMALLIGRVIS